MPKGKTLSRNESRALALKPMQTCHTFLTFVAKKDFIPVIESSSLDFLQPHRVCTVLSMAVKSSNLCCSCSFTEDIPHSSALETHAQFSQICTTACGFLSGGISTPSLHPGRQTGVHCSHLGNTQPAAMPWGTFCP